MISEEFKFRLKYFSPAPPDETKKYKQFNDIISAYSFVFMILFAYLFAILPANINGYIYYNFMNYFSIFDERISFLRDNDQFSLVTFLATLISCFFVSPIVIFVWAAGYWRTVIVPRKCRPFVLETLIAMGFMSLVAAVFLVIAFVVVPKNYHPAYPGMARFLFWPFFPLFGAGAMWVSTGVVFSLIVGFYKFIFIRGGQNG